MDATLTELLGQVEISLHCIQGLADIERHLDAVRIGDHPTHNRGDPSEQRLAGEQDADAGAAHAGGRRIEQPGLHHRPDREQEEPEERDQEHEGGRAAGDRHEEQDHARGRHAAHDDAAAAHLVGEMAGDR